MERRAKSPGIVTRDATEPPSASALPRRRRAHTLLGSNAASGKVPRKPPSPLARCKYSFERLLRLRKKPTMQADCCAPLGTRNTRAKLLAPSAFQRCDFRGDDAAAPLKPSSWRRRPNSSARFPRRQRCGSIEARQLTEDHNGPRSGPVAELSSSSARRLGRRDIQFELQPFLANAQPGITTEERCRQQDGANNSDNDADQSTVRFLAHRVLLA